MRKRAGKRRKKKAEIGGGSCPPLELTSYGSGTKEEGTGGLFRPSPFALLSSATAFSFSSNALEEEEETEEEALEHTIRRLWQRLVCDGGGSRREAAEVTQKGGVAFWAWHEIEMETPKKGMDGHARMGPILGLAALIIKHNGNNPK